jgi:hypothetical protein
MAPSRSRSTPSPSSSSSTSWATCLREANSQSLLPAHQPSLRAGGMLIHRPDRHQRGHVLGEEHGRRGPRPPAPPQPRRARTGRQLPSAPEEAGRPSRVGQHQPLNARAGSVILSFGGRNWCRLTRHPPGPAARLPGHLHTGAETAVAPRAIAASYAGGMSSGVCSLSRSTMHRTSREGTRQGNPW